MLDALDSGELGSGLIYGMVALAVVVAVAAALGRKRPALVPVPLVGFAAAGAGVIALEGDRSVPAAVPAAVSILAVAGVLVRAERVPAWASMVGAVPGAWLLAVESDLVDDLGVRLVVGIATVAGGALVASFDRRHPRSALSVPLVVAAVAGLLAAVPATDEARLLLGVALPFVLVGWPLRLARVGAAGAYPLVGLYAWVAALGGQDRPGAIVGAIACLGLLLAEPLAAAARRLPRGWLAGAGLPAIAAFGVVHGIVVFTAARVAGAEDSIGDAATIAVPLVVGAAALWAVAATARWPAGEWLAHLLGQETDTGGRAAPDRS